jgi:superfamily I DNA and/or RNA helicase
VALTRAKYLVVVVGNADTLGYSQIWNYFLNIMELKKSYVKIVNRNNYQKVV